MDSPEIPERSGLRTSMTFRSSFDPGAASITLPKSLATKMVSFFIRIASY
jgi:hypothetical protein